MVSHREALVRVGEEKFRSLMPDASNTFLGDIILAGCEFEQFADADLYELGIDPEAILTAIGRMRPSETLYIDVEGAGTTIGTPNGKSVAKLNNIDTKVIRKFPKETYAKSETTWREQAPFYAILTKEFVEILKAYKKQDKIKMSYYDKKLVIEGGDYMADGYEWREEILPPDIVPIKQPDTNWDVEYFMESIRDALPMLSLCETGLHLYTGQDYLLGICGAYASMDSTFTYWLTPRIRD